MLFGLLLAFLCAEIIVRMMGQTDADGNFFYENRPIGGIHPQVEWVREKIEQQKQNPDSRMIADPHTGWSPRPGGVTHEGMYRYESHGIRCGPAMTDYNEQPQPGVTRIAVYGDSFAHCDDVPLEQSWGEHLQALRNAGGRPTEVVNFGVSAYGMDQAFQRWRHLGKAFAPQIVLFGFQAENVNRNVNLLRGFYVFHTGIPFSKPRFILGESGRLKVINDPTLPVETVPDVMANMDDWQYAKHEWFYNPADFEQRWWHRSRFLSLLVDWWTDTDEPGISRAPSVFQPGGEPVRVTLQILREFRDEVEAQGGRFVVVHLPKRSDLHRLNTGRGLIYERLWRRIQEEHVTVDPRDSLMQAAEDDSFKSLYAAPKHAHYSDAGNRIIAEMIQRELETPGGKSR